MTWLGSTFFSLALTFAANAQQAPADTFQIGLRPGIAVADGGPANDIISFGGFGRYRLNPDWLVGASLDYSGYDFEQPAKVIGLDPATVVDASATAYFVSAWLEREFQTPVRWLTPFAGAGLGLGFAQADDVTGPLENGGTYDIATDPGIEIIPSILAGLRADLGRSVFAEFSLHADYRFSTWDVEDRVSGMTGATDDYLLYGGYAGIGLQF
jgi:hypothetical protein